MSGRLRQRKSMVVMPSAFLWDKGWGSRIYRNFASVIKSKIMETIVNITRDAVFRQVARRMEWVGTRSPEDRDYERVAMSESDKNLYHSFFDEAVMHAIDICRPFLRSVSNTDEALTLQLSIREESDHASLAMTVSNMLSMHVLALWQEIVSPERAANAYAKRDDYASKLQSILYHHPAPVRAMINDQ